MSIRRILAALETTDLPANEKLLLILLADHADDETGRCWPSQRYITQRSGLAQSTVNRTIKRLASKGLIRIQHRFRDDGSQRSNAYFVLPGTRPPCAREAYPPMLEKHTEPVTIEPTYISTLAIGEASKDAIRTKQQYRKLSAVERAELASERANERARAEENEQVPTDPRFEIMAERASHGPHLVKDDRGVWTSLDKRVGRGNKP